MLLALNNYFSDRDIRRRLLALLLCFLLIFVQIVFTCQETYANALALGLIAIPPAAITACAAILIAAGVTFVTYESAKAVVNWWYSSSGQDVRDSIINAYNGASQSVMSIPDNVWNSARTFVQTNYDIGANTTISNYHTIDISGVTCPFTVYNTADQWKNAPVYPLSSITIAGNTYTLVKEFSNSTYDTLYMWKNGTRCTVSDSFYQTIMVKHNTPYVWWLDIANSVSPLRIMYRYFDSSNVLSYQFGPLTGLTAVPAYPELQVATGAPTLTVDVTGNDVLSNPTWDVKEETEPRAIPIPATDAGVVGTTYTDIMSTPAVPDIPTTGDPTDYTIPTTFGINFEPLKISADNFKNKFPFSIPWDIQRAITSLVVTPEAPSWTIDFDSDLFKGGGSIDIDFIQFEPWAKIIRWGVLILFNFGLIVASRKLIGAGGD